METVLTLLLVRFAVVAGVAVVAALVVSGVAVALKRRGRLDDARRKAAPLVRGAARLVDERSGGRRGGTGRGAGGALLGAAARYLADERRDGAGRGDGR